MSNDGGPAFPRPLSQIDVAHSDIVWDQNGMTLRDYFAAQALTRTQDDDQDDNVAALAKWAYSVADAMLAERAE